METPVLSAGPTAPGMESDGSTGSDATVLWTHTAEVQPVSVKPAPVPGGARVAGDEQPVAFEEWYLS